MGKLFIVATPIGNLGDITLRALEVLKGVDAVICEDTRRTGLLLKHYSIVKPLFVLNDFNEARNVPDLIAKLKTGKNLALVSDAGTPLVSDPGFKLVRECIREGVDLESIPGPSSVITALTISGLPPDKFFFIGYPPKKDGERKKIFNNLAAITQLLKTTIIMFESPYRLTKTLSGVLEIFGDVDITICRELTKMHEGVRREKVSESITHFQKTPVKGELTILLHL